MSRKHNRAQEMRLRRMAQRQGLVLHKSRRRDPHALDYGVITIDSGRGRVIATFRDPDAAERWLRGER